VEVAFAALVGKFVILGKIGQEIVGFVRKG